MATAATRATALPDKPFYRIGEVSKLTATKQFVLRYWETEFPTLQPVKSPKGHRLYRREDIELVFQIKQLLYEQGFTIAGARRHLSEQQDGENGNGNAPTNPPRPSRRRQLALNLSARQSAPRASPIPSASFCSICTRNSSQS